METEKARFTPEADDSPDKPSIALTEGERDEFENLTQHYYDRELWTELPRQRTESPSPVETVPPPDAYNRAHFDQLVALQQETLHLSERPQEFPQNTHDAVGRLGRWMQSLKERREARRERKERAREIDRYEAQLSFGIVGAALMYADEGKYTKYW